IVGFAAVGFGQEATEIVKTEGAKELENSKTDGEYVFVFTGKTAKDMNDAAKYYENYFTVVFDESTQTAKINMVQNDERGRSVIIRLFSASGVRNVNIDGEIISLNDFMTGYLH
ncbi:MAG: hypothetical protein HWE22_09615, partial [Flavobacteriales bacterium]|nr:hypothetical protein [Flavobacteriales bacterium]